LYFVLIYIVHDANIRQLFYIASDILIFFAFFLGGIVDCGSITPETAPGLYKTPDDLIQTLSRQ